MSWTIHQGDALETLRTLESESVHCVVTSPPYWGLRDYGVSGQLGLERTPEEYVERMVAVFREVRRVLRLDGTCWVNMGDCYATGAGKVGECPGGGEQGERWKKHIMPQTPDAKNPDACVPMFQPNRMPLPGLKPKDLVGMPWRLAFALQADGWWLRSDIVWHKPNPMPESVTDRPTKAHEYIFLLTKAARYYYDAEAVRELAQSGPSDLKKMAEGKDRIGGKHKTLMDPLSKASALTNIGRKRSVGGKQLEAARVSSVASERRMGGFNERWDESEDNGTAPIGRNLRTVWTVSTEPFPGTHFATFPKKLVEPCVLAGSPHGGTVLDPFCGSGTVGLVALRHGRDFVGIELNPKYVEMAKRRIVEDAPLFNCVSSSAGEAEGAMAKEVRDGE